MITFQIRCKGNFPQRTPVVIISRSEDKQTKGKIMWRIAVEKKKALRIEVIEEVSFQDKELEVVSEALKTGSKAPKAYELVSHELVCIEQVALRGTRIVVPRNLRRRVLGLAHEGHQGIVKTKGRLRSKVWWPGIDKEAEKKC